MRRERRVRGSLPGGAPLPVPDTPSEPGHHPAHVAPSEYVDQSHRVYAGRRSVRVTETECAVPRAVCAEVLKEILRAIDRDRLHVGFPIEVRFVAADELSHLCPAYGHDTPYLAVHRYQGMSWQPCFRAVQDKARGFQESWASGRGNPYASPPIIRSRIRVGGGSTVTGASR